MLLHSGASAGIFETKYETPTSNPVPQIRQHLSDRLHRLHLCRAQLVLLHQQRRAAAPQAAPAAPQATPAAGRAPAAAGQGRAATGRLPPTAGEVAPAADRGSSAARETAAAR